MSLADDLMRAVGDASEEALRETAVKLLHAAERNIPVGDPAEDPDPSVSLRESGRVEKTEGGYRVVFDAPYAAKQEFDMRLKHPRGGGSRYLQRALQQVAPTLDDNMARKVAEAAYGFSSNRSHKKGRSRG